MKNLTIDLYKYLPTVQKSLEEIGFGDPNTVNLIGGAILSLSIPTIIDKAWDHVDKFLQNENLSEKHINQFKEALEIFSNDKIIFISFYTTDWLIQAIEDGASGYSIKEEVLSKNYTISKAGYKYTIIPLEKDEPDEHFLKIDKRKTNINDSAEASKLKDILTKLYVQRQNIQETETDEGIQITDKLVTTYLNKRTNKEVTNTVYRIRTFNSGENINRRSKPISARFRIFRGMSNRPGTSEWQHKGFDGIKLVESVEDYIDSIADAAIQDVVSVKIYSLLTS